MRIYKKRVMNGMLKNEEVIFFGHLREGRLRYDNREVLRLSRRSVLNNIIGLGGVFYGPMVKLREERIGCEERKLEITEVRIGHRFMLYEKYRGKVGNGRSGVELVIDILRWRL